MAAKIGVKLSPHLLADLVRIGAKVTGADGFTAHLTDRGIPEDYKLINSGVDRDTGEFFLVFGQGGKRSTEPVEWRAPVYERIKEANNGTAA